MKRADFSRYSWWCRHAFRYNPRVDLETVWMLLLGVSIVTQLSPHEGLCFTLSAVKGHQTVAETIRNCEWHFPLFWAKLFIASRKTCRKVRRREACLAPLRHECTDTEVQRQQPLVQYPNAVIHPHNWIDPNAPLKTAFPAFSRHFPSRFKNVMSQCFSDFLEQFQP